MQFARFRSRKLRVSLIAAALVAVAAVAASVSVGAADAGGFKTVSQGPGSPVLSGYSPFENTDPNKPEAVSFILRARNVDQLQARVAAGMPGGYLTAAQFAQQYGQSPLLIGAIRLYLGAFGIKTSAMSNNLVIRTTGTAGQYNKAFGIVQKDYRVPAPGAHGGHHSIVVHGSPQNPKVPSNVAGPILAILGLSNYPTQQSNMVGEAEKTVKPSTSSDLPNTALLPGDFATRYNLAPVQQQGTGAGRTIGIVTLASVKPDVVSDFWSAIGLTGGQASASRITPVDVDGGSGPASDAVGSDETALDVEQSGALAPGANVRVYQAPNTDAGFVDAFFQAASENAADTVSASWGESETVIKYFTAAGAEDPNYTASFDEAFLELAAQGQSTFLSSGDSGAYPASRDLGTTDTTAGNPDDSPWVTSAGGTTLPGTLTLNFLDVVTGDIHQGTVDIPSERAWGWDYLWKVAPALKEMDPTAYIESHVVGGGGGYSGFEQMPAYQHAVGAQNASTVPYLTATAFTDPSQTFGLSLPTDWNVDMNPSVAQAHGNGRATPDLATDGDPETGYLVLYTFGDGTDPNAPESVEQFGGTSFVAPQLNGVASVIDSALGRRVGFWNPAIYRFAAQRHSPFTPLDEQGTNNDNLLYTGTPHAIYNVGTGLGVPDFAQLAQAFATNQ